MATRRRTGDVIGGIVRVLRKYFISRGLYTESEANELIKPGKLMDYSTPLAKPYIAVLRSSSTYTPMTLNNNIDRYIETNPLNTISKTADAIILKNKIAMRSAIVILVYANSLLELENYIDDITYFLIGFIRILEEELKLQFIASPMASEPNFLEDNKQVWTSAITLPFEMHFNYVLEVKRDVYNDFFMAINPPQTP